jgi:hypothetical protein
MARDDTVTFALEGDITLPTFRAAIDRFERLVASLTEEIAAEARIRWVIADLGTGSATATVRAVPGTAGAEAQIDRVVESYLAVGKALAAGETPGFAPDVQEAAWEVASVVNGEVEAVRFETAIADAVLTSAPEPATAPERAPPRVAFGGVRGRVQTLSSRGRLRFTLYDALYDKAVSCYLAEGQEDIMRDAWGHVALVEGWVTRDPATDRPLSIRGIERVTLLPEGDPHGYRRARGAVLGRELPEAIIRRLRDGD